MPVEKTQKSIASLVGEISRGEIRLPEIQRAYVWKPTQVAKLVESLYRGYPTGSLLFWRTDETPETRAVAADAPVAKPAMLPLYLLDGQQRLTSLYRVFTDHPEAQIVFNVETEAFQNQSAATKKDPRWVKVYDVVGPDADLLDVLGRLAEQNPQLDRKEIGRRLQQLAAISKYEYHMEVLTGFPYQEIAQIFVRVNSGGRSLKTTDLALATLSARWPGVLAKLEAEAERWAAKGYGDLDVTFLTRALTGAVLGRGLSAWSHGRLAAATDEELERGWQTVRRGLEHLVPLLQNNLGVTHSQLMPSHVVLIPLIVLLGERPDEPLDPETAKGLLYFFLVATIRNRYSGSTDTLLGQDIPAARSAEPVKALLANLGVVGSPVVVTEQMLAGRSVGSPYFFLSFLVTQDNKATDWWYRTKISAGGEGSQKLQYHHIHPQATLKKAYTKAQINDLANLAFISAKANMKIRDRSPADYFQELDPQELEAHYVPTGEELRTPEAYLAFLAARRKLLAEAMTRFLDRFRPSWLKTAAVQPADNLDGCSVEFTLYASNWERSRLHVVARRQDTVWEALLDAEEVEAAVNDVAEGLDSDVTIGDEKVPLRVVEDAVELPLGPFVLVGTPAEWKGVLERERQESRPVSECPVVTSTQWIGDPLRFPVVNTE
ncbi:hypothetical protein TH66_17740 [Carbonactinospora thermoautotrophica]|uniref:GmrSD restriction endonucleases N-terminal domain-containing protein n=1 Tax=Carbonactinospora thermoautotrophica TaxID=1469144 RepID=A0A132NAR2_9ACTN|nr:DUF262 domain-containing protein [Carbonactinospora thermoautotrophica]KWW97479.1 hypothetical protein TH66_17740 [Carbonactinospora thermoautotrophica]KWX07110.1 hypothetical protein TR74_19840 [Carbonactinospora thermoautotrophica]